MKRGILKPVSEELILTIDGNKYDLTEGMYFFPEDELKCFGITKNLSTTERCRVGDDGCPVPIEDYRYFITGQNRNIVTKNEIPVGYFENESATKESPDTLPAGQKVKIQSQL